MRSTTFALVGLSLNASELTLREGECVLSRRILAIAAWAERTWVAATEALWSREWEAALKLWLWQKCLLRYRLSGLIPGRTRYLELGLLRVLELGLEGEIGLWQAVDDLVELVVDRVGARVTEGERTWLRELILLELAHFFFLENFLNKLIRLILDLGG